MATLYIVSTPIGNRGDISLRALEVLFKVEVILCEDTRKTGLLLEHYRQTQKLTGKPDLISFYEENEEKRIPQVIGWLKAGKDVALVSNSGTPLVSDPGFKLVRECVGKNISVFPIPGASALLAGLVISGLPTDKFIFLGFLPKKQGKKEKLLEKARQIQEILPQTVVFYESPFRIVKTLNLLAEKMPEARVVVGRELTKKFEEVERGKPAELVKKWGDKKIKGELVVMFS